MENASKALQIAAGVILGVLLLALIVYFFKSLGSVPQERADKMNVEQLAAFNMEYEVYCKNRMYGVDVISCLNKAKDNNDKYFAEDQSKFGFLTEGKNPPEYVINVIVKLKRPYLEESVEVYYIDDTNVEKLKGAGVTTYIDSDGTTKNVTDTFRNVLGSYTNFSNIYKNATNIYEGSTILGPETRIQSYYGQVQLSDNTSITEFSLVKKDGDQFKRGSTMLETLLDFANKNMKVQVKNKNSAKLRTEWNRVIWKTALYDLKQKKFTCDSEKLVYNKKTGRIQEIYFEEV